MKPVDNRLPYAVLGAAFSVAISYQLAFSITSIQFRRLYDIQVVRPFQLQMDSDRFLWVAQAVSGADIGPGDELLEVEGQPYECSSQLAKMLASKQPGDKLTVKVLRSGHAQPETFSLPLTGAAPEESPLLSWIVTLALTVLTPAFCLLLGFGVAAIRPRDPLAWLLLALMLSFAQMSTTGDTGSSVLLSWPDILRPAGIFYHTLLASSWSIWVLLFGIYFPEHLALDRRLPWIKWILIVPIAASALGSALTATGDAENFKALAPLLTFTEPLDRYVIYISMLAISCFFFAISAKIGQASTADARRRLILLVNGTSLSLTPLFILALWGIFRGGFGAVPPGIWISCVLMLAIFPITLAYVIVVQRALDVRVVIRQGLQYALARRGIYGIQILLGAVVVLTAATLISDPARNRPRKIQVIGFGITAVVFIRRGGNKVQAWTDRRFFREAYNSEQILSELSGEVLTMVETKPLLETVAKRISGSLHVPCIAMLVKENGHYAPAYWLGYEARPDVTFDESAGTVNELKRSREPLRVYFDDDDSWVYRKEDIADDEREQLRKLEPQLLLPLAAKQKLIGFMTLGPKRSEEPYSRSDVQLLGSVATQTGLALENSHLMEAIAAEVAQRERLNRELEIAREVQERLFPQSCPAVDGLDYAGNCRPALGVGGDYYDFLPLTDGSLGIAVGDVSGKGIPAALLMASLQASLRGQTIAGQSDLAKLMSNINRLIFEATPANRYATFFYGQYEPSTRRFAYVNGGHNAPMVFRAGEVLRLEDGGPAVGLFKPARYSQASIDLAPGDVLVLYTDGISEAMDSTEEEWGEDRLMEAVKACRNRPASEMIECLIRDADAFAAGAPQHDDMTLLVVKVR